MDGEMENGKETGPPAAPFTSLAVAQAPKNAGGRPPMRPEDRSSARIEVGCLESEKRELILRAAAAGESLSAFLVRKGLSRPAPRVKAEP